jgi:hypothetical protein
MKARVKVQPSGLLSVEGKLGVPWPEVGETVDLPESVAKDMIAAGVLEEIKPAKKVAAKDKVEKRPASKAGVETRKKS